MSRKLHVILASLCFTGFGISLLMLFIEDSRTYTPEEAFVQFLQHGFELQISVWLLFACGFLACAVFGIWRVLRWRHD